MYKLFRRECLYSLEFDGDRFEFDLELVIKLIKKGYIPEEISINYKSRSYSEGKKIKLFIDAIICLKSIFKYKFFYRIQKSEAKF